MKMTGTLGTRTAILGAVVSLGMAGLTGCTGVPAPQRTVLTTKAAGEYYLATTCKLNAAQDAFAAAENSAEQSSSETGPELDNLKSAALAYEKASRAAADRLGDPQVVWPTSIRKSILVLRDLSLAELPPLREMATAKRISDEAAATQDFPDTTKARAAVQHIRSTLGLPLDGSSTCSAAGSTPTASSAAPAAGELIEGTGYTFHVPVGWTIPKDAPNADAFAISAQADAHGVFDTVNVLPGPATSDTPDEIESNATSYLEQVVGATDVVVRPRVIVAGVESEHISSLRSAHGITEWDEQYSIERSGIAYLVTFAFNASESQAERDALAESVLATWTWA